jgi:hypothetical protein
MVGRSLLSRRDQPNRAFPKMNETSAIRETSWGLMRRAFFSVCGVHGAVQQASPYHQGGGLCFGGALLAVAVWFSAAPSLVAQVIPAPFGLQWGEAQARIVAFAERVGSKTQVRSGGSGRETIEVLGPFPNQRYQRLGFTFQSNHLVQIATYYPAPENTNEIGDFLAALRGEIEQSFGPGQLLETGSEKNADGHLETRRVFRWEREGCAIWLVLIQVQPGGGLSPRRGEISVVYANLGLGRRLEIESARGTGER